MTPPRKTRAKRDVTNFSVARETLWLTRMAIPSPQTSKRVEMAKSRRKKFAKTDKFLEGGQIQMQTSQMTAVYSQIISMTKIQLRLSHMEKGLWLVSKAGQPTRKACKTEKAIYRGQAISLAPLKVVTLWSRQLSPLTVRRRRKRHR